ncbi:hypothetical protein [Mycobacteroides abscessus]|uniref:hypothetical protein n=1 Tax=Mycobacteroides abscessus TaxID=36809 RepID=UPI001043A2C3|nr:hypothetical protein [Mycobacteroides abscessus]
MGELAQFNYVAFLLGFFGALAAEFLRIKLAQDELFKKLNSKRAAPGSPKIGLNYPRYYFLTTIIYATIGGGIACLLPPQANAIFYVYVGAALPKFVGLAASSAERLFPVPSSGQGAVGDSAEGASIDDTSITKNGAVAVERSVSGRYHATNGFYSYITA